MSASCPQAQTSGSHLPAADRNRQSSCKAAHEPVEGFWPGPDLALGLSSNAEQPVGIGVRRVQQQAMTQKRAEPGKIDAGMGSKGTRHFRYGLAIF